jgi:hypothetical protein
VLTGQSSIVINSLFVIIGYSENKKPATNRNDDGGGVGHDDDDN